MRPSLWDGKCSIDATCSTCSTVSGAPRGRPAPFVLKNLDGNPCLGDGPAGRIIHLGVNWMNLLSHLRLDRNFETYPLVICYVAIENGHRNSGFTHWKWWFSIVMLVYQRVISFFPQQSRLSGLYLFIVGPRDWIRGTGENLLIQVHR